VTAVGNEDHGTSHVKMLHIKRAFTNIHATKAKEGEGGMTLLITDQLYKYSHFIVPIHQIIKYKIQTYQKITFLPSTIQGTTGITATF